MVLSSVDSGKALARWGMLPRGMLVNCAEQRPGTVSGIALGFSGDQFETLLDSLQPVSPAINADRLFGNNAVDVSQFFTNIG